jgi:ribosomal protein S18 acetylase RimI-like enzyme
MNLVVFSPEHVEGVMALCRSEGRPSLANEPDRARKALSAPGVITIVALENGSVVGFAQLQTDSTLQAHLSLIAVAREQRGRHIGTRLIEEAFARSGAERIDVVSTEGSDGFYESLPHRRLPGYRLYPRKIT